MIIANLRVDEESWYLFICREISSFAAFTENILSVYAGSFVFFASEGRKKRRDTSLPLVLVRVLVCKYLTTYQVSGQSIATLVRSKSPIISLLGGCSYFLLHPSSRTIYE